MPDKPKGNPDRFLDWGFTILKPASGESAAAPMPEHMHWYACHGKLKAPSGKFKVILADTFDGTDASLGVYADRDDALRVAREHAGTMKVTYVYDHAGRVLANFGSR